MTTEPVRNAFHSAAERLRRATYVGATAITMGLAALSSGHAQTKQAQTILVLPPVVVPPETTPDAQPLKAIPQDVCNYLFDRVAEQIQKKGKNFISPTTRNGFKAFFAFDAANLPTCKGPREIPWEPDDGAYKKDFEFILAMGVSATRAFKMEPNIGYRYGFGPAARPVAAGSNAPGQRSELRRAPGG